MRWLRALLLRLGEFRGRNRREQEFAAEMHSHLQMHIDDNLRAGMSPEEARRNALIKLGGVEQTKELYRERRGLPVLEVLLQDLRFAARMLRKNPGFTAVAVLTLALGMGATSSIFSVVDNVLFRPLPYANHEHLLRITETHPGSVSTGLTYATFLDLDRDAKTIENISAHREWLFNLTGGREPQQVGGALVSGNFFNALGSSPLLGRVLLPEDDRPGGDNRVVVLSYALWQSRFGSDPRIIGKTIEVNAERLTVIGVMRPDFDFPHLAELWCPLVPGGEFRTNRRAHLLTVIATRKHNETLSGVNGELVAFAESVEKLNPGVDDPSLTLSAVSLQKSMVAPVRPALILLFFAVALLLLMACANVANLLLARTAARRKEIAVRLALGASRLRLARFLLTESVFVSLLGGTVGLLMAQFGLAFIRTQSNDDFPRFAEIHLDWRGFVFAFGISVFSGLFFGLAPALSGTTFNLNAPLKEGVCQTAGSNRRLSSSALTVLQFALATILLTSAGLLGGSLLRVLNVSPGFNPVRLLTLNVFLSPVQYPERDPKVAVVLHDMLERIRALPGVRSAGLVNALPITGGPGTDFVIEGRPTPRLGDEPGADIRVADPGYFSAMGIPLIAGRTFQDTDRSTSSRVVVINQTLARTFWPNESPLGKRITMKDWGPPMTGEIIGVVGDVKGDGLDAVVAPMIYWPYTQFGLVFNTMVVRTDGDPLRMISGVKDAIWFLDKNQPVSNIRTIEQLLSDSVARRRLYVVLLGVFAVVALLLAAAGIYGVVSYSVSQKTREIGIRLALGAERRDVLRLILGNGAMLALFGEAIGFLVALGLSRLIASMLFGVSATDPMTFAVVAVLLTAVALVACFAPARRAMRVDPMVALRYE